MSSCIDKTIYLHDQHQLGAEAVDQTESTAALWIDVSEQDSDEERAERRDTGRGGGGVSCHPV